MTVGINEKYPAYKAKNEFRNKQRRAMERLLLERPDIGKEMRHLPEQVPTDDRVLLPKQEKGP